MKKTLTVLLAGLIFPLFVAAGPVTAEEVKSLRGGKALPEAESPPTTAKLILDQESFARNYKQQPPLIPHKVEKYRINLKTNRCLRCHDKDNFKEEEAPMVGKSHYLGADGKQMEKISMKRYFCTQCHVPQADARPLVKNTFKSAE